MVRHISLLSPLVLLTSAVASADLQNTNLPRVSTPTSSTPTVTTQAIAPVRPAAATPSASKLADWRLYVTATVFWIGETPTERNPTPNTKSSWDQQWTSNFGGFDDPNPAARIANFSTGEFRPKAFTPKLNPFYVALPYNDVVGSKVHKPEAPRVIPWFHRYKPAPGKTVCKGRWIQIWNGKRSCFAQWEDCGPWVTDDWEYVFTGKAPKNSENGAAGIDISPSVRDYLQLNSGQKVHWRFVEAGQVPGGPWKKYGFCADNDPALQAQRRYMEQLREQRDRAYRQKS